MCGRTGGGGWGITLLGLFSPQKGSQELTLPKSDSQGYVVRNQWSRTSRSPSTRPPSAEESRSKNTSLKVEMGTKGTSTLQDNSNNNNNVRWYFLCARACSVYFISFSWLVSQTTTPINPQCKKTETQSYPRFLISNAHRTRSKPRVSRSLNGSLND